MAQRGSVKPFPEGPAPCVCPVKAVEEALLAECRKLVVWVEKHRKLSLKCSLPTYLFPEALSFNLSPWVGSAVGP